MFLEESGTAAYVVAYIKIRLCNGSLQSNSLSPKELKLFNF